MIINNYTIVKNAYSQKLLRVPIQKQTQGYCSDSRGILDSLHFLGNVNQAAVKKSIDTPIKDDEEFREVMERVYDAVSEDGKELWLARNYKDEYGTYKYATDIEMGLIPYCGEDDNSEVINMYLSGRLRNGSKSVPIMQRSCLPENIDSCVDMVRVLDYSLNNLDKEFGTYKGIVFRKGYMDEGNGQFYSTTRNLSSIQDRWADCNTFDPEEQYSVIRLKDGHKIYEFQEKMGSTYAESEEEVLASRKAKFEKVKPEDMDEELLTGREQLAANLFWGADKIMNGTIDKPTRYTREQLLDMIDVYDQI